MTVISGFARLTSIGVLAGLALLPSSARGVSFVKFLSQSGVSQFGIEVLGKQEPIAPEPEGAEAVSERVAREANRLVQEGRFSEAIETLEEGLEESPDDTLLNLLLTLVRVQRDEERDRLIERGLALFFDDPGASCRTWSRLLLLDPEDQDAARQVDHLRGTIEPKVEKLVERATEHLAQGEFHDAADLTHQIRRLDCDDGRSDDLTRQIETRYEIDLEKRLVDYDRLRALGRCTTAVTALERLVGDPWLSPTQTARAYLTLGACQLQQDSPDAAAESFRLAVEFDPLVTVPSDLAPHALAELDAVRNQQDEP